MTFPLSCWPFRWRLGGEWDLGTNRGILHAAAPVNHRSDGDDALTVPPELCAPWLAFDSRDGAVSKGEDRVETAAAICTPGRAPATASGGNKAASDAARETFLHLVRSAFLVTLSDPRDGTQRLALLDWIRGLLSPALSPVAATTGVGATVPHQAQENNEPESEGSGDDEGEGEGEEDEDEVGEGSHQAGVLLGGTRAPTLLPAAAGVLQRDLLAASTPPELGAEGGVFDSLGWKEVSYTIASRRRAQACATGISRQQKVGTAASEDGGWDTDEQILLGLAVAGGRFEQVGRTYRTLVIWGHLCFVWLPSVLESRFPLSFKLDPRDHLIFTLFFYSFAAAADGGISRHALTSSPSPTGFTCGQRFDPHQGSFKCAMHIRSRPCLAGGEFASRQRHSGVRP